VVVNSETGFSYRGEKSTGGEKVMSLKSVVGNTCVWCVAAAMAALTLLAVTWTVILVSG
jgi:hypothetical protein